MSKWLSYPQTKQNEAGYYLILYRGGISKNDVDAGVEHFYKAGDIIGYGKPEIKGTAEERLLDSVLCRPIIAAQDGFYCSEMQDGGGDDCWELKPIFWTFLPDAPEGYEYGE